MDELAIGIDLGTTNSCVAVMKEGRVKIIPNEQGKYVTPSYVSFNDHERLIGHAAKNATLAKPQNTIFDAKRLIGRKWDDPTVQSDIKYWPFTVKDQATGPHIEVTFKGEKKLLLPEQISAMVLEKMQEIAEKYLNRTVTDAVITVPAYFDAAQRQATIDAGHIAGLNVRKIINEPTAAALAYAHENREYLLEGTNILVFDLGGGTFDVTILRIEQECITVKASNGDTHLGGEDFDCRLVEYCTKNFKKTHGFDLREDVRAMRRLRYACECAKQELSSTTRTEIVVDGIHNGIDLSITMSHPCFEHLNLDLLRKTLEPVQRALDDAKLKKTDIDKIVLVGGSTRIPMVRTLLKNFFGGQELDTTIHAEKAIAYGAAIQAAALISHTPNEILGRTLRDVTPLSLGIEYALPSRMGVIIPRNTMIPAEVTGGYTTFFDNQEIVAFRIRQGESQNVLDNILLGEFKLTDFPIAPKGVPEIDVTFEINANGILIATAIDLVTGSTSAITIENVTGRLKKEQIERLIKDAENYREEDEKRKQTIQAVAALEIECYDIKGLCADDDDKLFKISELKKSEIIKACDDALASIERNEFDAAEVYEKRRKELRKMANKVLDKGIISPD